jgi:hypothetical protein
MLDSFELRTAMRGEDQRSESFFSYVRLESRIAVDHPLRVMRCKADQHFGRICGDVPVASFCYS